MNRCYFYFILLCATQLFGQSLTLNQSFEQSITNNWNFIVSPAAFNFSESNDVWDAVESSSYIDGASDGSWFWECRGFSGSSTNNCGYLTFETVDLVATGACTLVFDYYASDGLEEDLHGDGIGYEYTFDNGDNWDSATRVEFEEDTSKLWVTEMLPIPEGVDYLRLRLWAYTSAAAEFVGFDNISLTEGAVSIPELLIESPAANTFYENSVNSVSINGTATNISGVIVWTNELTTISGEIAATNLWVLNDVSLSTGANPISITATNQEGLIITRSIVLKRGYDLPTSDLGAIAFVNLSTGTESLSFVALKDLAAHTVIRLTDSPWDGVSFGTSEDDLIWSNSTATAAGTVVVFYDCNSTSSISNNNIGVIESGYLRLNNEVEGVIAYYGDSRSAPSAFLAAISTAGENLNGTGLIYGQTAVSISKAPTTQFYSGLRSGQKEWSDYLPLINDATNWSDTTGMTESYGDLTPFSKEKCGMVIILR